MNQEELLEYLADMFTVGYARAFNSVFPLLKRAGYTQEVNFFWNAGAVAPGKTVQYKYNVPEGQVDAADWLQWDLGRYDVCDVSWIRDGDTIWSETNTSSFMLDWDWFRAEAHEYCIVKVTNNGTSSVNVKWRGQCFFVDVELYNSIRDKVVRATESIISREKPWRPLS